MLNDSPPPSLHPLKPFPSWEDSTSACPVPLWGAQLTNDLSQGSPLIHSSLVQQAIINLLETTGSKPQKQRAPWIPQG